MAAGDRPDQRHGGWRLPVVGGEVTQVRIDFAFGLVIETYGDDPATLSVRISGLFTVTAAGVASSWGSPTAGSSRSRPTSGTRRGRSICA